MTNVAVAQRTTLPTFNPLAQPSTSTFDNRLKAALEHARRLTHMYGYQSADVAIAWETVEELETAKSHQPVPSCQYSFDYYCAENPEALECRSYDC
ncbi:Calvin cycle protein CP12 [cf. Phormidesmis sp. LEGE 11477]|uniref:Calvin cycle protein CP12 n=1 Tax=cf. Phormidesmis sp. LEGE 11477 TaxID=1828680 RepID=UPI0018817A84|nr:Calvin cycle protein CP12 [cf. Phormidesmis sp. LEGE 11477]MBE9064073.1 Calvin cycle protein CP12 [cf. Phormidesmis sp. LEGE 11477]